MTAKQRRPLTPSQTVGPFFHPTLLRDDADISEMITQEQLDQAIVIHGYVLDGERNPVPDAGVELWQADEDGRYLVPTPGEAALPEPVFSGYGRTGTDESGYFRFLTVKPGTVEFDSERSQAPHILVTVYARGLLNHLVTRIYFPDEENQSDPILEEVPAERRETLIAQPAGEENGRPGYRFDIVLQGERETVFFNV